MSLFQVEFSYSQDSLKIAEFVWFENPIHHLDQHPLHSTSYVTVVPLKANEMWMVRPVVPGSKMSQIINKNESVLKNKIRIRV
jgi:hypothetical protein